MKFLLALCLFSAIQFSSAIAETHSQEVAYFFYPNILEYFDPTYPMLA